MFDVQDHASGSVSPGAASALGSIRHFEDATPIKVGEGALGSTSSHNVKTTPPSPFRLPQLSLHSPAMEHQTVMPVPLPSSRHTTSAALGMAISAQPSINDFGGGYSLASPFGDAQGQPSKSMPFGSNYGVLHIPQSPLTGNAPDAARIKTEQLRLLQEQNAQLLVNYEELESRSHMLAGRKEELESQLRAFKIQLIEMTNIQRNEFGEKQRLLTELEERSAQAKVLADQNREFMRRIEATEERNRQNENKVSALTAELQSVKDQLANTQNAFKGSSDRLNLQAKEITVRTQEVNALRAELDNLKLVSTDNARKAAMEIESLQEALRLRKEKQFTLLEKAAAADDEVRKTRDEVVDLAESLRTAQEELLDLRARMAGDEKAKNSQLVAANAAFAEAEASRRNAADMRFQIEKLEHEKLRLESEVRAAGDNVREMAQKVFAVLERLKLSEVGKTKAIEALKARDNELALLKRKHENLTKDSVKHGKAMASLEAEIQRLQEQLDAIKQTNTSLSSRCREETKVKLAEHEQRVAAEDRVGALQTRLTGLLKKLQHEEEEAAIAKNEAKQAQEKINTLSQELRAAQAAVQVERENVRFLTATLREKTAETDKLYVKLNRSIVDDRSSPNRSSPGLLLMDERTSASVSPKSEGGGGGGPAEMMMGSIVMDANDMADSSVWGITAPDAASREKMAETVEPPNDTVRQNNGRGRFYLDPKPTQGYILIKAERKTAKKLLKQLNINDLITTAQKSKPNVCLEKLLRLFCQVLGLALVEGEDRATLAEKCSLLEQHHANIGRVNDSLNAKLAAEESARRQIIVGYARAAVAQALAQAAMASTVGGGGGGSNSTTAALLKPTSVALRLSECCLGDEEVHALAVVLREEKARAASAESKEDYDTPAGAAITGASVINELQLARNNLTDGAARPLASIIGDSNCAIRVIDLRGNHFTADGVKRLAEALENNSAVQDVTIKSSWRIEASLSPLGVATASALTTASMSGNSTGLATSIASVHARMATVIIDVRDQRPMPALNPLVHLSEVASAVPPTPAAERPTGGADAPFTPFESVSNAFSFSVMRELSKPRQNERALSRSGRRGQSSTPGGDYRRPQSRNGILPSVSRSGGMSGMSSSGPLSLEQDKVRAQTALGSARKSTLTRSKLATSPIGDSSFYFPSLPATPK